MKRAEICQCGGFVFAFFKLAMYESVFLASVYPACTGHIVKHCRSSYWLSKCPAAMSIRGRCDQEPSGDSAEDTQVHTQTKPAYRRHSSCRQAEFASAPNAFRRNFSRRSEFSAYQTSSTSSEPRSATYIRFIHSNRSMIQLNTPKDNITHHKLKIKVKVEVKANVKIEVRKGKVRQGNSTQRKARQGKAGKGKIRRDNTTWNENETI